MHLQSSLLPDIIFLLSSLIIFPSHLRLSANLFRFDFPIEILHGFDSFKKILDDQI